MKTVVGLFDNYAQAQKTVNDVEAEGISRSDISLIANNDSETYGTNPVTDADAPATMAEAVTTDAGVGAAIGGTLGLMVGASLFVIPGLGWMAGVGWLAGMLEGAAIGAVTGGLIGALVHMGVPEEDAAYYNEGVRRGGTLIAAKASDDRAPRVAQILRDNGAINIEERSAQWRQEGFLPTSANPAAATTATTVPPVNHTATQTTPPVTDRAWPQQGNTVPPSVRNTEPVVGTEHVRRNAPTFDTYANEFRNNWQATYGNQGGRYEDYEPSYRYGFELANNPNYRGRNWSAIENNIQNDWNARYPYTWDRFKNSIRYGFDRATRGGIPGEGNIPGIQTGGRALDGTPDTRGITEKVADAVTGDRIDDKTGKPVA